MHNLRCLPRHVGIIMDGNVRWAKRHGIPVWEAHRYGVRAVRPVVEKAAVLGIDYLTLYCFSLENRNRPKEEVDLIMNLLGSEFLEAQLDLVDQYRIRFRMVGERSGIPAPVIGSIERMEEHSKDFGGLTLTCAINYGSRQEIAQAVGVLLQRATEEVGEGADVMSALTQTMETGFLPELDLIIRTSGEKRLSNFLIWQAAYSEFDFVDEDWPEFTAELFAQRLEHYASRERRFGGRPPSS